MEWSEMRGGKTKQIENDDVFIYFFVYQGKSMLSEA
jgi:hypothetical protein